MKPTISIIIPVYRETERINTLLTDLRLLSDTAEIIVVDGAPDHGTIDAIQDPEIITIKATQGRARQQNTGAAAASADILLFLHADTRLPRHAISQIHSTLKDPGIAGGAFALRYDAGSTGQNPSFAIIAATANLRSRLTRVPYGDQAIFIRTQIFRALQGFSDLELMEDLDLMTRLRRSGHAIRLLDTPVYTSPRRHLREGIARCTLRNWTLRLLYHAGIPPRMLAALYRPHS